MTACNAALLASIAVVPLSVDGWNETDTSSVIESC